MKYSQLKTQWPWFALSISSKVKCYTWCRVNWKVLYDLLYVFHTNFDHMMHHLWDTTPWKMYLLVSPYMNNSIPYQCYNDVWYTWDKLIMMILYYIWCIILCHTWIDHIFMSKTMVMYYAVFAISQLIITEQMHA